MDGYNYVITGVRKPAAGGEPETIFLVKSRHWVAKSCAICTDLIMDELGAGDEENGGSGDLYDLWDDIFEILVDKGVYQYADCEFSVRLLDI